MFYINTKYYDPKTWVCSRLVCSNGKQSNTPELVVVVARLNGGTATLPQEFCSTVTLWNTKTGGGVPFRTKIPLAASKLGLTQPQEMAEDKLNGTHCKHSKLYVLF